LAVEGFAAAHGECTADVGKTFGPAQESLCLGWNGSTKQAYFLGNARRRAQSMGKTFGLIELAFTQSSMVKRNGHYEIPSGYCQGRNRSAEKQISEERLEAKGAVVFVTVDNIQNAFASNYCGAGEAEVQSQFATIGAFERVGDLPFIGGPATFAKWRIDKSNPRAATGADKSFSGGSPGVPAKLADLRIAESEGCVGKAFEGFYHRSHEPILGENTPSERGIVTEIGGYPSSLA
jgi:hypothetical protein